MITAIAPGKLYLAGEYAVVTPGQPAVVAAISSLLTVTATGATTGELVSQHFGAPLCWSLRAGLPTLHEKHEDAAIALHALEVAYEYLAGLGETAAKPRPLRLVVESELDSPDGRKYGLGSSGALTVALLAAVLASHGMRPTPEQLVRLAVLAGIRSDPAGSGGDYAASALGGIVYYSSPDRDWLKEQVLTMPVAQLLGLDWPGFRVRRLAAPRGMELVVGWSSQPASTASALAASAWRAYAASPAHDAFLTASSQAVAKLAFALEESKQSAIVAALGQARAALGRLQEESGLQIETPELARLTAIALDAGAAAKTSGAGGGDCGIALVFDSEQAQTCRTQWSKAGILPLEVSFWLEGVRVLRGGRKTEGFTG